MARDTSGARRYLLELAAVMTAYGLVLIGSIHWLKLGIDHPLLRTIVAMSPVIPGACTIWVVMRQFGRLDELMRKIQLDALALAFAGTAVLTFSYGFLEGIGYPRLSLFFVWPLMALLWIVGICIGNWRYRSPAASDRSVASDAAAN